MVRVLAVVELVVSLPLLRAAAKSPEVECTGVGLAPMSRLETSKGCLSCHDGSIASDVPSGVRLADWSGPGNHPVMVSYLDAYLRNPSGLVSPQMLDHRVQLEEGKVQCTTCHSVSPQGQWSLVKSNQQSALCLSCHRM